MVKCARKFSNTNVFPKKKRGWSDYEHQNIVIRDGKHCSGKLKNYAFLIIFAPYFASFEYRPKGISCFEKLVSMAINLLKSQKVVTLTFDTKIE